MKPPVSYFGGKTRIADRIVAMLPRHEHYIEPFAGSLAVLLAKPRVFRETVNDLDGELVNFWRVVRDRPAEFERVCALTPHSRAELDGCYDLADVDELESARRLYVRLTQGRSGQAHQRTGWRYWPGIGPGHSARGGSTSAYLGAYVSRILPCAERLIGVSLECRPAVEVIERFGREPGALIYADPPYLEETRLSAGRGKSYRFEMRGPEAHRELAAALTGTTAAVVLSGYRSPLYDELYDGWHRYTLPGYTGNGKPGEGRRDEVLWSNRPFPARQAALWPA